jgi:hypothetical protein
MIRFTGSVLAFLFLLLTFSPKALAQECPDPLAAILTTLDCIEKENATCASVGYNTIAFRKLHNGIDTNTTIDAGGDFWNGAFSLSDLILDKNHQMNVGPNQASIRYVETVVFTDGTSLGLLPSSEYPFAQVYTQYEHALVTVDDECKMIIWDQYGDNKEQQQVDETTTTILCIIGFLPPELCKDPTAVPTAEPTAGPTAGPTPAEDDSSASSMLMTRPEMLVLLVLELVAGSLLVW